MDLPILETSYNWNDMTDFLLCLASYPQCEVLKAHPSYRLWPVFMLHSLFWLNNIPPHFLCERVSGHLDCFTCWLSRTLTYKLWYGRVSSVLPIIHLELELLGHTASPCSTFWRADRLLSGQLYLTSTPATSQGSTSSLTLVLAGVLS